MSAPPPASDLAFSQVREDPLIDERVIELVAARLGRPIRVLMVASGGCTALGLLALEQVERVVAVDANPAQLCLVELRRQAMIHLPLADQLRLLGAEPCDGEVRAATYARLRAHLPEPTRAHFDARPDEIASGVLHAGRFEALFRELTIALADADLDPLARPAEAASSPRFREVFERVFERGALAQRFGPAAVDYSMDRSFGEHFADVFARALMRWPTGENYFLHQVFEERYLDVPGGRPPCLEQATQAAAIARGAERLELARHRFDEALDAIADEALAHEAPFDLVQTSNISDWMPVGELRALLVRVRGILSPGGAVLGRRLNGDHRLADVFADVLEVDGALCDELVSRDRSFFYREVVVGFRSGGGP
ncbi:MAG: BtaA family protein [Myxococcota bacterium]|nr:BtaA family protein [Myxococcota bacterium]